jgi:hypothetical protein
MNEFYQKLWELNLKLEEVVKAFTRTDIGGDEVDREFAKVLGDLEIAYSKIVELVRRKRGLPEIPTPWPINNEDVKWILGIQGAKEPAEIRKKGVAIARGRATCVCGEPFTPPEELMQKDEGHPLNSLVSAEVIEQMESASYPPLEPTSRAWIYSCRRCGMPLITIERSKERYSAFGLLELKRQ